MIQLYNLNNENYELNGDYILHPISAIYDSGKINELDKINLELPLDEYAVWKEVKKDCVIKCKVPEGKYKKFRVTDIELDSEEEILEVEAKVLFNDLSNIVAKDYKNDDVCIVATGQCDGDTAIKKALSNTKFKGHSDIKKYDSVRWERKYITDTLISDDDNSFVKRWGGELYCDDYDIYINNRIGEDHGVTIKYGKNIKQITQHISEDYVTRIIPTGYDGLRLTGKTPWVDSELINKYPEIHERVINFNDVKVKQNADDKEGFNTIEEARAELIKRAKALFDSGIDKPSVNIKIKMQDLSNIEEYKEYKCLESAIKGDTIHCIHSMYNIDTTTRVIRQTWDILEEETIEIEIGDVEYNYFENTKNISSKLNSILDGDSVKADKIAGVINSLQTVFKAQRDIAQPQEIRAMLFEDLVPGDTFGACCIGTKGLQIANERTADGRDWKWNTFIMGGLVYADWLVGKLKTVLITNADGSFQIDLTKTGGCEFYTNNKKSMLIKGSNISFYNFLKENQNIGGVGCGAAIENGEYNPNKPYSNLWHENKSYLRIDYRYSDNKLYPYILFDLYKIQNNHATPIEVFQPVGFVENSNISFYKKGDRINPIGYLGRCNDSDFSVNVTDTNTLKFGYSSDGFNTVTTMVEINKNGFKAYGDKNCIQQCEYGDVKFSSVEDIGSYLTWREYGGIYETELDDNGEYSCIVTIPQIIKSTINTRGNYNVEVNAINSLAAIGVFDMTEKDFTIKSTEPCKFNFVLTGRRKGFEQRSLEEQILEGEKYMKVQQEIATNEYIKYGMSLDD